VSISGQKRGRKHSTALPHRFEMHTGALESADLHVLCRMHIFCRIFILALETLNCDSVPGFLTMCQDPGYFGVAA
jgi:hypothetical protein